jgi:hypothetical protein
MSKIKLTGNGGVATFIFRGRYYSVVWNRTPEQTWKDFIEIHGKYLMYQGIELMLIKNELYINPIIEVETLMGNLELEVEDE